MGTGRKYVTLQYVKHCPFCVNTKKRKKRKKRICWAHEEYINVLLACTPTITKWQHAETKNLCDKNNLENFKLKNPSAMTGMYRVPLMHKEVQNWTMWNFHENFSFTKTQRSFASWKVEIFRFLERTTWKIWWKFWELQIVQCCVHDNGLLGDKYEHWWC